MFSTTSLDVRFISFWIQMFSILVRLNIYSSWLVNSLGEMTSPFRTSLYLKVKRMFMKSTDSIGIPVHMLDNVGVGVVYSAISQSPKHTLVVYFIEGFFVVYERKRFIYAFYAFFNERYPYKQLNI